MGRFDKEIMIDNGLDRRALGYYSTPTFVSNFMAQSMLAINPNGISALDPCVGKEELIKDLYHHNIEIDGIDIYNHGPYFYCNFIQQDFIEFYRLRKSELFFQENISLKYDYYIVNPPYNCHEVDYIRKNKKELGKLFKNIGVHNMYSMFFSAIIDSAKDGALISIITSDSFLTARMHNSLREQILNSCSIHYLVLCPTDLFWEQKADVRTVIMILQKGKSHQGKVKILNRPKNLEELKIKLDKRLLTEVKLESIINQSSPINFEFVVGLNVEVQALFSYPRIGDKFKCITGISTGKDELFIAKKPSANFLIPFYKNPGSRKFHCEPDGYLTNDYLQYDKEIKNFMVRNKAFMLREGITCSSMGLPFSACYLPEGSTFGVNANIFCEKQDIWWVISYLNSSLVTYLVRGVLIRSNMITSGYVSKIPVIPLSKDAKIRLGTIANAAHKNKVSASDLKAIINEVDEIIFSELELSDSVIEEIKHFAFNLQSRV